MEIPGYGFTAVVYSNYLLELEVKGQRSQQAGRATEVFVQHNGQWLNPGWHMDGGKQRFQTMTDKWGRRWFKSGAVLLVVLGLVHSLSLIMKQVPANDTERQLLDLMANYKFDLMGSVRSMADLQKGFSITFMLGAIGLGVLDLLLSGERAGLLKRVALFNMVWLAAMTAVSLVYFFVLPTSFHVFALLIFALAWLKLPGAAKKTQTKSLCRHVWFRTRAIPGPCASAR